MSRKYFGTDGIRGRVGEAPISADFMLRLGNAYGHALRASVKSAGDWRKPVGDHRQGHAHLQLHVRIRARGRTGRGGRGRAN